MIIGIVSYVSEEQIGFVWQLSRYLESIQIPALCSDGDSCIGNMQCIKCSRYITVMRICEYNKRKFS